MGNFIKKQIKGRAMKMPMAILVCALLVVGAGIAYEAVAVGSVTITPVSNGGSISIDTTSNADNTGSSEFTFLSGPTITESMAGDIAEGIHTITLPSGWEFDTTSNITFYSTGVILSSANVVPNQYSFSFDVTSKSTSASVLGFMGLKVRPTGTTPSSGNIAHSGAGILGINESINFGTLATIAGTVTQVAFTTQPGDAMYGFVLNPQPVVKTQDQFGNDSTNGLTPDNNVVLTLNETGGLVGTTFLNIGTNEGNGTVIFSGLTVNVAGNGNTLTASATGLTPDTSDSFDITPKNINVTAQIDTKVYDGNANSSKTPTVDALAFSDTVAIQPIQEFDSKNIDASLLVPSGLGITGGNNNYNITYIDASGAITKQEVTVTGATTDSKIYDGDADADVDFSNSTLNGVVSEEDVTLDLTNESASFDTKNVGSENPVTVSGLVLGGIDAGNYSLTQPTLNDGVITKRTLTVTAVGDDKVYDGNTIATVTPLDNRVSDDILTVDYTSSSFVDENVGDNKPVNVSGISISGTDAGNYALGNTTAVTSADITAKGLTVINSAVTPKIYDGTRVAVITGTALSGVISSDTVTLENHTSGTFDTKNVGTGKTVTTAMTITGDGDEGNYTLVQPTVTGNITEKEITLTAVANEKVYDGGITAGAVPALTGGLVSGDVGIYSETYGNKSVGDTKTLTPAVVSIVDGENVDMTSNYAVTLTHANLGKITKAPLTATITAINKPYDGNTDATILTRDLHGTISGDTVSAIDGTATFTSANVGIHTVSAININLTGADKNNYSYDGTAEGTASIIAKDIFITPTPGQTKVYGETDPTSFGYSFDPALISPNTFTGDLGHIGGEDVGNYNYTLGDLDAGTNYALILDSGTFAITAKPIIITAKTDSKTYDGTDSSDEIPTITPGLVAGDVANFLQTYDNENVGIKKTLLPSGMVNDGNDGNNYSYGFVPGITGVIGKKDVNVTAQSETKAYDGTTDSSKTPDVDDLESEDTITTNPTQVFDSASVGSRILGASGLVINDGNSGGNYNVIYADASGAITKQEVTVTGATTDSKTYDGDTDADVDFSNPTLNGVVGSENVTLDLTNESASFDNENVGTGKTVTVSGLVLASGDAGNYTLTQPTLYDGVITPASLTVTITASDKPYDGNTDATITGRTLTGIIGSDVVIAENGTATFDDKDAEEDKVVSATGINLTGEDKNNYSYKGEATGNANITPVTLIIEADDKEKEFGTPNPDLTASYDGFVNGEDESVLDTPVTLSTTANQTSPVGNYPIVASGATDVNYDIIFVAGILTIVDTTPPNLVVITQVSTPTKNTTPSYVFSSNEAGAVTYVGSCGDGDLNSLVNGENTTTFGTDTALVDGAYGDCIIKVTDASGNEGLLFVNTFVIDNTPPVINNLNPGDGSITSDTTPTISVNFFEEGSGVDIDSVIITVDGVDETKYADITIGGVVYVPSNPMSDGRHEVAVEVKDSLENSSTQTWDFKVASTETKIEVSSNKWDAYADDTSEIKITAEVRDEMGNPVTSGTVNFVASPIGDLSDVTVSLDENGLATAILTSAEVGNSTVTAYYDAPSGPINSSAYVYFNETEKTISVVATPNNVLADGLAASTITATVLDNGVPMSGATVNFVTGLGTLSNSTAMTNSVGEAIVTLTSVSDGSANIKASYTESWTIEGWTYVEFTEHDNTPPTATQFPVDGSMNVAVTVNPYIDFSEAMNEATLVSGKIELREYDNDFVSSVYNITTNSDGTTRLTFIPNSTLDYEEQYYFFIGTGVEDLSGNKFASDSWYFGQKADHEFTVIAEDVPVTSYDIPLNAGWNLISLPLIPNSAVIVDVLADENFLSTTNDNVNIVKYYNSTEATPWSSYDPVHGGSLGTMEDGKGYWMFMDNADVLTVNGTENPVYGSIEENPEPVSYFAIGQKWNLIGFKSVESMDRSVYGIDNNDSLQSYNGAGYIEDSTMNPGFGYWLYAEDDDEIIPPVN